jgi:HPt (histidine-containing phosphotransfer) domain-containing protein
VDFNAKYASTAKDIAQALAADDINQVHSQVHNIKGLAGNLSAVGLHSAATKMDDLVKQAISGKLPEAGQMDRIFAELKNALAEALASCQNIGPSAAEKIVRSDETAIPSMPFNLAKQTAERLRNAVDMGNISELKAIAQTLGSGSNTYGDLRHAIVRMAEDFDLEGILKLANELETAADA